MLLWLSIAAAQDCQPDEDCDGDGFLRPEDCDEGNPLVNPGSIEDCTNEIDEDCDGLINEGCDAASRQGALWGGGLCQGGDEAAVALLFLPIWARRRR